MYEAFVIKLPYNLQKLFLLERPDYVVLTRQSGSFRKTYVCTTKSNTVSQLLVLSCGIALKIILKMAKLNKLLRQN